MVPLLALCVGFAAIPLVWPGDAPWINDEPRFVHAAAECNATGTFATEALKGHLGVTYGPMAIWFYAAVLRVIHDLVDLVVVHALLMSTLTALGIGWIATLSPRLHPAAGSIAFLSPYFWFYDRLLWDNTLLIPLSAVVLAAYVAFSVSPRPWPLWVVALGCTSMAMTHLMCAPLILAIVGHAAWVHRSWFRSHWGIAALPGMVSLLIASPYILSLVKHAVSSPSLVAVASSSPRIAGHTYDWRGWLFPWLGGRVFSAYGIDYFFGDNWWLSDRVRGGTWVRIAGVVSCVAIILVWVGLARAVVRLCNSRAHRDADFHLACICVAAFAFQCLLDGVASIAEHPHYYNGIWICYFYFIWTALSEWPNRRSWHSWNVLVTGAYAFSLAVVVGFLVVSVHKSGGTRDIHYGATLRNQIEVAKQLNIYSPDSPLQVNVSNFQLFPQALSELREFYGLWGTLTGPRRVLTIRYLQDKGVDGWLTLQVSP